MSYHNLPNSTSLRTTNDQGQVAPPGYHYMPDGSLMLDSEMSGSLNLREKVLRSLELNLSDLPTTGERRFFNIAGDEGG